MNLDFKKSNQQESKQIYWQVFCKVKRPVQPFEKKVIQLGTANKWLRNNGVAAIKSKKGNCGEDRGQLSYSSREPRQEEK